MGGNSVEQKNRHHDFLKGVHGGFADKADAEKAY